MEPMLPHQQRRVRDDVDGVIRTADEIEIALEVAVGGVAPDMQQQKHNMRFLRLLIWPETIIGMAMAAAAQMSVDTVQGCGQSVSSSSHSNGCSSPVGMFQCKYGYPLAILLCFALFTLGHM